MLQSAWYAEFVRTNIFDYVGEHGPQNGQTEGIMEIQYESVNEIIAKAPEGMTKFRIDLEEREKVAFLTLNRPDKLNAFSQGYPPGTPRPRGWSMFDRYMRAVTQEVKHDPRIRVVVITGAGRAFSAGADVKDWGALEELGERENNPRSPFNKEGLLFDEHTAMMHFWIKGLVKPTIAMVNGLAVGMGADLAAACDIRVAADDAFFQWAYVLRGISPMDGGLWLLPRLVGQAKALEWMMTGDRIFAQEALQWGLVNKVAPLDSLRQVTLELASKIAANPPAAVQSVRFGAQACATLSFQDGIGLSYLAGYSQRNDNRERMIAAGRGDLFERREALST